MDLSEQFQTGSSRPAWLFSDPYYVIIYRDNVSVDAKLLAVTEANRLKRALWHEVGHHLEVGHDDGDESNSIMNQMPLYLGQSDVDDSKSKIDNMHWSDDEGTKVRQSYTPNEE